MDNFNSHVRKPLNLYAIFGYLLPGFFLTSLLIIDYDISAILRLQDSANSINLGTIKKLDLKIDYVFGFFSAGTLSDFKFVPVLLYFLFCYLIGHLVSAISSLIFERLIVKRVLGYPSEILINGEEPKKCKWFLQTYRRPFGEELKETIKINVDKTFDFQVNKSDYYWLLYSYIITTRPYLTPRVHHFVNLFGFSRNVCATFIIYIFLRLTFLRYIADSNVDNAVYSVLGLFFIASLFMFYNYLKLFKRQAVDIFYLFLSIKNDSENILFTGK